jgi:hypothetical protein
LVHAEKYLPVVSRYNGYYDRTASLQVYVRYCEELLKAYEQSKVLFLCNFQLLSLYFRDALNPVFYKDNFDNKDWYSSLIDHVVAKSSAVQCFPYQFIEKVVFDEWTMFRVFSTALMGKTVLVVSPFAESIASNFYRRHEFFKRNYVYPEFVLKLINCPITYAGLPSDMYPDVDWFGTANALSAQISAEQFDIALLSCGSYAMPLGIHIEQVMKRKAIYVGGVLQLYFGIMGRRYQNPFFLDQINPEKFILPLEGERYLKYVTINEQTAREALAAYF